MSKHSRKAKFFERGANALSWLRIGSVPFLAERIVNTGEDYRSWKLAGAIGILALTDKADGWMGRTAARLRGGQTSERGAWLDQLSDKAFTHGLLGSIAVGEAMHGSKVLAGVMAINQAVVIARDTYVTSERRRASDQGIETKAQMLGKVKTAAQLATLSVVTSPIIDHLNSDPSYGDIMAGSLVTGATGLAIASGISLVRDLRRQSQEMVVDQIAATTAPAA